MEQSELNIILKEHTKWLEDTSTGKRANLRDADLRGIDLRGINLSRADLRGINLRDADLRGIDLRGVNLSRADLRGVNLRDTILLAANLRDADLRGVNLRGAVGNDREIKTLHTEFYTVVYTSTEMAIGCEQHAITDWFKFDDKHIKAMDGSATEFWTIYKPILQLLVREIL